MLTKNCRSSKYSVTVNKNNKDRLNKIKQREKSTFSKDIYLMGKTKFENTQSILLKFSKKKFIFYL